MKQASNLPYYKVLDITAEYLGPAAKRFVDRQIANHIGKEPDKLTIGDLSVLIDWMRLSFSLLTDNDQLIEDYLDQLRTLAAKSQALR